MVSHQANNTKIFFSTNEMNAFQSAGLGRAFQYQGQMSRTCQGYLSRSGPSIP